MDSRTLQFKPRARLIRTIGDRLISGPEAAVIELVKNAHDADATFVRVTFQPPLLPGKGLIIVEDDGHGMKFSDVEEKWMEPATTDKSDRLISPGGRSLLGSKGIGRFAAAKLGRQLSLVTTAKIGGKPTNYETTLLTELDWDQFERVKYLSDISFPAEVERTSKGQTGTRLEIKELRDTWNEKSIRALHHEMRRMISPIEEADKADFRVYLDLSACTDKTSGFDGPRIVNTSLPRESDPSEVHRVLPYPVLSACDYEVQGTFVADQNRKKGKQPGYKFDGSITIRRGDLKPEEITLELPLKPELGEGTFGTALIHLFIFDRDASAIRGAMSRAGMGDLSAAKAREILDGMTGVAIYRDRFRIRPYGDSDKDWLTLDARRVNNPTLRIGHNQVSGIIVIGSEKESGLIEQSNREGLEINASFHGLQRLVLELFARAIEPRRIKFREDAELGRSEPDSLKQAFESAELKWTQKIIDKLPPKERDAALTLITKEANQLQRYLRKLEEKQAALETKVTLGLIIGEVLHEGRPPVAFLQHEASRLTKWWHTLFDGSKEAEKNKREVPGILRGMGNNSEKLRVLFSALEPLSGANRGKPRLYSPSQAVTDTLYLLASRINALGVNVSHKNFFEKDLLGHPEDIATAVTNIIDNALYWFEYDQTENPKISIKLLEEGTHCTIEIIDNGPGISSEFRDKIFDIGFTLKPFGTGLGLNIALEAIGRSNGSIALMDLDSGAGFKISLPAGS